MTGLVALAVVLLEVDPNTVQPGWTPLLVTLLLGGALALLYVSLRRQVRKIDVPADHPAPRDDSAAGDSEPDSGRADGDEDSTSRGESTGRDSTGRGGQ